MEHYNMIFKRREQKYLLTLEQYKKLTEKIAPYIEEDEYAHSTIGNIYYDTPDYELIRSSIEKPVYKEKLRLRSYGTPVMDSTVFLEIKKKYRGTVYKRRISLPLSDAVYGLKESHITPIREQEQVSAEINYFLQHYSLMPVVFLGYDRDAFRSIHDSQLRITFDFNIRSRRDRLSLSDGPDGTNFFQNGEVVCEIKTIGAYPFWLIHAMEECQIYPASFSKYGNIYKKFIFPDFIGQ